MGKETLKLKLAGEVPLTDFVSAMENFGELVRSLTTHIGGAEDIQWDIDYLQTGSAIAGVRGTAADPGLVSRVIEAYEVVGRALYDNTPIPYPDNIANPARKLTQLVNGHVTSVHFITDDYEIAVEKPVGLVETEDIPLISGETIIYGRLMRVGGTTPRIMVNTVEGENQFFQVDIEMAKNLAGRLYTTIGLVGNAKWRANDLSLSSFSVSEVLEYQETDISKAISELSGIASRYFADIDNVSEFVENLRSENWEG